MTVAPERLYELLRKKAETIQLASPVLFESAQQGYLNSGRGAIFFLFASEHDVQHDSDDTKYSYVHLAALVDVTTDPVWDMVQTYDPRQSFVLLLGAKITPGETEMAQLQFYTVVVNPACVRQLQAHVMHNIVAKLTTSVQAHNSDLHHCGSTSCCKEGKLRCSRCQDVWYCSADCQLEDWRYHKQKCVKK